MNRWLRFLAPMAGLIAVILLFAILTRSPERYLSGANLRVVLAQTVIVAIGALGMTVQEIIIGIVIVLADDRWRATRAAERS